MELTRPNGNEVRCIREQADETYACCAGPALRTDGTTEFSVTIVSSDGSGGGMLIGVCEDGDFPADGAWGQSWGLAPWNGKLFGFPDPRRRDKTRAGELRGAALMRGDMRGTASGTLIRLRVDMSQRRLYVQATPADEWTVARGGDGAPLQLSAAVRPLVRCAHANDAFAMGAMTHTEAPQPKSAVPIAVASDESSRLPVRPPPKPPPAEAAKHRFVEAALRAEVAALKAEREKLRLMYEAEKERRMHAEEERREWQRRYDEERERVPVAAMAPEAPVDVEKQRHIHEIEASLIREAMIANDRLRASFADTASAAIANAAAGDKNSWRSSAMRASLNQNARSSYASAFVGAGVR